MPSGAFPGDIRVLEYCGTNIYSSFDGLGLQDRKSKLRFSPKEDDYQWAKATARPYRNGAKVSWLSKLSAS